MNNRADRFFEFLKTKKVGLIGFGISHINLVKLFLKKGISVTVFDKRTKKDIGYEYNNMVENNITFCLGKDYLYNLSSMDIIFRTPGMDYDDPVISKLRAMGKVITSEMEVFFDICPCKIYGITGSDGKTTTTTIISEFLKKQGHKVHLGGNIGTALLPIIDDINLDDICVVELSSFQLISMRKSPDISVITNLSPNHLDVHKTMDRYIASKMNILLHQNAFSKAILNLDSVNRYNLLNLVRGNCLIFGKESSIKNGCYLDNNGDIHFVSNENKENLFNKSQIKVPGNHNVQNYLAAIAAVYQDVDLKNIKLVVENFRGVEHRLEFIRNFNDIKWYNDSIATTPTRTIAGLDSFDQKLIIIAGGYDKNISFDPLASKISEKVKVLILMGNTGNKIAKSLESYEFYNPELTKIIYVTSMENAVNMAKDIAEKGDIVCLSPASASFDMYNNFEERGNHFKKLVNKL